MSDQNQNEMGSEQYRAAVCLNNYGASLLGRGQYSEAAQVLRDSLMFMNNVFQADEPKTCTAKDVKKVIQEKVHFATQCMANGRTHTRRRTETHIQVVGYGGTAQCPREMVQNHAYAVVIESLATDDESLSQADMDIHTAIVVYNSAVARIQGSKTLKCRKRVAVSKACIKLFRWAHAILSKALEARPREVAQLNVLILVELVRALKEQGEKEEALRASRALSSMRNTFEAYEHFLPSSCHLAAAA